jgi:hypothetical protein
VVADYVNFLDGSFEDVDFRWHGFAVRLVRGGQ